MTELLKSHLTFYLIWVYQHLKYRKVCRLDYLSRVENSTLGHNTRLYRDVVLKHSTLGDYSYVARGSHIQLARIGRYCSIGANVMIGGGVHPTDQRSTHPLMYDEGYQEQIKPVVIGSDCWIGQGSIILDGVTIGDGVIVGAGSVVSHNIKPFRIVGGVPAESIGERKVQDRSWYKLNK